jgi:two-component system KDP operon response regulator KdpE
MNWPFFGNRNPTGSPSQASPPMDTPIAVGSGKKILVVDDDAVIVKTTSAKLKSQGYQVVTASDASEAMSALRQHKPDLILLDVCFPPDVGVEWDGLKIMTWMQRMDEAKNIPIIVVSGSEPEKYRERCLATGAAAFFYKPVQYQELLPFIAQFLRGEAGWPAPGGA